VVDRKPIICGEGIIRVNVRDVRQRPLCTHLTGSNENSRQMLQRGDSLVYANALLLRKPLLTLLHRNLTCCCIVDNDNW
jgi:hypothetical protein